MSNLDHLDRPLACLHGVGPKIKQRLAALELRTLGDLLTYFPRDYEDLSKITLIKDVMAEQKVTIRGVLKQLKSFRSPRQHMTITNALVSDESGSLAVIWFNQPFISKNLTTGTELFLSGAVKRSALGLTLQSPEYEKIAGAAAPIHTGRIVPKYPLTAGLTQKQLRYFMKQALERVLPVTEYLPPEIRDQYNLFELTQAFRQIHFPDSKKHFLEARRRHEFDELYIIQLYVLQARQEIMAQPAATIKFNKKEIKKFVDSLPFKLTNAQRQTAWRIFQDIAQTKPMNRLLEGDVGSGKTLVAALAMLNTALNGWQSVLMAPTEILAQQHYQTFQRLFKDYNLTITLLTQNSQSAASVKNARPKITPVQREDEDGDEDGNAAPAQIKKLPSTGTTAATNTADIIIGTHAIIQEGVQFSKLGLVVVDEQHRFGVNQRKELQQHSGQVAGDRRATHTMPHFLSMTATPIPRTLALTIYGDLDLSILDEMPPGRRPVITRLAPQHKRAAGYEFIRKHLQAGEQCFVICPLIDPADELGVKAVTTEYEYLAKEIFPDMKIAMLHGKMPAAEKEAIMRAMQTKKIQMLVATSVIEVGVDIPGATIMLIEGAERFGLAQLHQFRGRVGRSDQQSYCFLFTQAQSAKTPARLRALVESSNGFALAEKDLQLRGAGEIYGTSQSGFPAFRITTLLNHQLIRDARAAASQTLSQNWLARSPQLKAKLQKFTSSIHLE